MGVRLAPKKIRDALHVFLGAIKQSTGRRPILYLTKEADTHLIGKHFPDTERWLRSLFGPPSFGGSWRFWQFANRARVPGIHGPVDLNLFNGSQAAFEAFAP